jgi:aryl-alcohol dehydrogenase-like predicted oxidoreductase
MADCHPNTPHWATPRDPGSKPFLTLGTMNFGRRTPAPEAERIVRVALERGITVFDTANAYNDGDSERILGRALGADRKRVCVATKVGFARIGGKPEGLMPVRIRTALDESLARLGSDYLDLYYLHVPDHQTPIEESLGAIREAIDAGKVRSFGVSNYASWQIVEIAQHCDRTGMPRPVVAQQLYNLLIRQLDLEYWRFAARYRMHTSVYNPLAGGLLTGRYHAGDAIAKGSRFDNNRLYQGRYWSPRMIALAAEYEALARDLGMTLVQLAYAWLATAPAVDSILIGPAAAAQLEQALDAVTRTLTDEARARVDAIHTAFLGTETSYAR